MPDPFANYQNEIYLSGVGGVQPEFRISMRELEKAAYEAMTPEARGYVEGGAGSGHTMRANRQAFERCPLDPPHASGRRGTRPIGAVVREVPGRAGPPRADRRAVDRSSRG